MPQALADVFEPSAAMGSVYADDSQACIAPQLPSMQTLWSAAQAVSGVCWASQSVDIAVPSFILSLLEVARHG